MSFVVGNPVVELWTILDANSAPLTGMTTPAHITFTLHRQSGSTMVSAPEAVSFAEIGATGHYYITFTPLVSGLYILQCAELNALTLLRTFRFADIAVVAAGAQFSSTYTNAFCAETDIERWLQQAITASSTPSDTQAASFAETRASVLMTLCAKWGYTVTPATVTVGSRLEDLLRDANAIGAALDYTIAQQFGVSPSLSARPAWLSDQWLRYVGGSIGNEVVVGYLESEVRGNLVSLASDHIISGDTLADPSATTPYNTSIGVGMGDEF